MASVVLSFLISTGGSLAQVVLDLFSQPTCNENLNEQIIRCSPEDNVFEEFDSSEGSWKEERGSLWRSFVRSLWISLQIAFLSAFCVGLAAVCLTLMYIVLKSQCDPTKRLEVTYNAVEMLFLYFWHPLLLLNVFRVQFLREANVFTTSLLGALLDIVSRLFLALFGAYEQLWKTIVGFVLYLVVILTNSFSIARKFFPQEEKAAVKVAFKFSAQFILGPVAFFLGLYVLLSAYTNHQDTVPRLIFLGLAMLTAFPVKVISRYGALSLEGLNHPGNSFMLVAAAYGSSTILFRILQAELEDFSTFIALSLVHGVFQLVEVLMLKVEGLLSRKLRQCCRNRQSIPWDSALLERSEVENAMELENEAAHKRAHARLQRFLADTHIQGMLFEMTALLISVSIIKMYGIVNMISIEETSTMATELVKRIYAGVFMEFVFNVCCVLILTRYMNIPILRVWKIRWKSHLTVFIITTVMSVVYYVKFMVDFVKKNLEAEGLVSADENC